MKLFLLLLLSLAAHASWYYNEDGGFGIYQPEGWAVAHNGRSSTLTGPVSDRAQSWIFLGSDWQSRAVDLPALEAYVKAVSGDPHPRPITISELPGFRAGTARKGSIYLLRVPTNVIEVKFDLKGSADQLDEGRTMLGSIEVRTKGNEYP
jgi:hypothetical protein